MKAMAVPLKKKNKKKWRPPLRKYLIEVLAPGGQAPPPALPPQGASYGPVYLQRVICTAAQWTACTYRFFQQQALDGESRERWHSQPWRPWGRGTKVCAGLKRKAWDSGLLWRTGKEIETFQKLLEEKMVWSEEIKTRGVSQQTDHKEKAASLC